MTDTMLKLERHRYGNGKKVPVLELQDRLQAVTVAKDISGKEDIQLSMLGTFEEPQTAFTPGDFVTLRDQTGATWSWGRVSVVRSQLKRAPGGAMTHTPYAVMVQGWYDFLSRSKVHVLVTSSRPKVGTMFNLKEWSTIADNFYQMYGKPPGEMLAYMMREVVRIRLPESLGGGWFADQIPVVYDRATALRWAPEFADIEPVSFGSLMPQINSSFMSARSTDVGALIANMFLFENSLVELIPYLSTGVAQITTPPVPSLGGATITGSGRTDLGDILGMQPVLVYRIKPFRTIPLKNSVVSKIVYRREEVEAGYLDKQLALYDGPAKQGILNARAEARKSTTDMLNATELFSKITFNPETIASLPFDIITQMTRQRADTERVNATTINAVPSASPSGTTITDVDYLALPITIDNQIEHHGLRLRHARWNLYPSTSTQSVTGDIPYDVYYRAVAAQVMQFYEKAHLYETGSMSTHFTHTLYQRQDSPNRAPYTYDRATLGLEPGRWFRTSFERLNDRREPTPEPAPAGASTEPRAPSDEYYGYITSVSHSVQRLDSGALAATSQVGFQRGHFAEMWDLLNGLTVPLGEIDVPQGQGGRGQQRGGGRGCALRPAEPAAVLEFIAQSNRCTTYALFRPQLRTFNQGLPAASWATDARMYPPAMNPLSPGAGSNNAPTLPPSFYNKVAHNFVPTQRPEWLRCWFLEAISVMPVTEYSELRAMMEPTSNRVSLGGGRIVVPFESEDASRRANLWALAACAFVIERYWQTRDKYDDVRLRIRSIPRAVEGGYHKLYAAMDFYLEYPTNFSGEAAGAFQMWTSLTRLADAGRIPYGGRGLYLNVNPQTGITGTAPDQANSPSKKGCQYPPGGSSWTHYDLRAMWGISTKPVGDASFFTTWIATDWDGDGKDEFTLGDPYPPPKPDRQAEANKSGVVDSVEYVFANIADPDFKFLGDYTTAGNPRANTATGVGNIMRKRRDADPKGDIEKTRVGLRDEVRAYFNNQGKNDKWLHEVTAAVPNMTQVFTLEQQVGQFMPPPPPRRNPDAITSVGDYYYAKNADGTVADAPLIVMFGGARIAGKKPTEYLVRFAQPLFDRNHVFITNSDQVAYSDVYDAAYTSAMIPKITLRTMLAFSSGIRPVSSWILATAGAIPVPTWSSVYLVDAYLGSNTPTDADRTKRIITDLRARTNAYRVIYTDAPVTAGNGNGMSTATRNQITAINALRRDYLSTADVRLAQGFGSSPDPLDVQLAAVALSVVRLRDDNLANW